MEKVYCYIVWGKAVYAQDKIKYEVKANFTSKMNCFINWNKAKFNENLKALYGHKLYDVEDKIDCIGTELFSVFAVYDENPKMDYRETSDGKKLVNVNVYDKGMEFQKMTAGWDRVSVFATEEEAARVLLTLLGTNYEELVNNKYRGLVKQDTKAVTGFESEEEFLKSMEMFGENKLAKVEDKYVVICKCRTDVERYLGEWANKCEIYGELEGDLAEGSLEKIDLEEFVKIEKEYKAFKETRQVSESVKAFLDKYGLAVPEKKNSIRISPKITAVDKIKRSIKLVLAKIKNG